MRRVSCGLLREEASGVSAKLGNNLQETTVPQCESFHGGPRPTLARDICGSSRDGEGEAVAARGRFLAGIAHVHLPYISAQAFGGCPLLPMKLGSHSRAMHRLSQDRRR